METDREATRACSHSPGGRTWNSPASGVRTRTTSAAATSRSANLALVSSGSAPAPASPRVSVPAERG